jgi:hypothetical protein
LLCQPSPQASRPTHLHTAAATHTVVSYHGQQSAICCHQYW